MLLPKFDFRDLLRAPRLALSLQRMWITLAGVGAGWLVYLLLTYLALMLGGWGLPESWERFGILPALPALQNPFPWYSWILHGLGALTLVFSWLLANTAHARAVYMSAKGEHFYSWRQSYAFAWRKAGAVVMTPASLAILILLIAAVGAVVGLMARIPYAGEIGIALFTLLWFVMALLLIIIMIALWFSLIYTPAIVATTDEDAFEAVFQLFSLTWNQPWRLLLYQLFSLFVAVLATGLFAFIGKQAVGLTNLLLGAAMGSNYADIANNGLALVQAWTLSSEDLVFSFFRGFTPFLFYTQEFYYLPASELARPTVAVAAYLYAVGLLAFGFWIAAYGLGTLNAGHTLAYMALRRRKDGLNLLERVDKEEEVIEETEAAPAEEEPPATKS